MPVSRPWRTRVLLIGTSRFTAPEQRAPAQVERDLLEVRAALTDPRTGVATRLRCTTLLNRRATDVLAAVRQRRWRPTDDLLIVYYSGHGYLHPHDFSLWLSTADSDARAADDRLGLRYRTLAEELRARSNARQVVVVLDCCYSGNALVDVPDEAGYYVLASVQKNRRTPQPRDGSLSPYTEVLVDVLRKGDRETDTAEGLTVGHLADVLAERFSRRYIDAGTVREVDGAALTEQEQKAMRWKPRHSVTDGSAVIARPEGRPEQPEPGLPVRLAEAVAFALHRIGGLLGRLWRGLCGLARRVPRQAWAAVATVLALAVLASGTTVVVRAVSGAASCAPPLELRVLAGTEDEAALTAAADAFERSPANHRPLGGDGDPGGCRRVNVSVYAAAGNAVVSAFRAADAWSSGPAAPDAGVCAVATPAAGSLVSSCPAPLRDVGPQPDVWIPDATAELTLAQQGARRSGAGVVLTAEGSVAADPLAVGVSPATARRLARAGVAATAPWRQLLPALLGLGVALLRPTPTTSGTGLLQTAGLYLDWSGTADGERIPAERAAQAERSAAVSGESAPDDGTLLCGLQQQAQPGGTDSGVFDRVAVAVSEKALADLARGRLTGAACGVQPQNARRLAVLHPAGVPALDLPYVAVRWPGALDRARRDAAAERFRDFLLGADGRAVLSAQGYRPPSAGTPDRLTADRLAAVLTAYQQARQPAQVLFVLDVSGSMAQNDRLRTAVAALGQGLSGLGPQDGYGIWTMPGPGGALTRQLVPPGTTDRGAGPARLAGVRVLPAGASLYTAIGAAAAALRRESGRSPRLLVVLTDGNDTDGQQALTAPLDALDALNGDPRVPLDVIGMDPAVCDAGSAVTELARMAGGQCLAAGAQLGQQLAGLVATAGHGQGGSG